MKFSGEPLNRLWAGGQDIVAVQNPRSRIQSRESRVEKLFGVRKKETKVETTDKVKIATPVRNDWPSPRPLPPSRTVHRHIQPMGSPFLHLDDDRLIGSLGLPMLVPDLQLVLARFQTGNFELAFHVADREVRMLEYAHAGTHPRVDAAVENGRLSPPC